LSLIRFDALGAQTFKNASAELSVGLWVVLAYRDDAATEFTRILAGVQKPSTGQLLCGSQPPYSTPAIRRTAVAVLPRENYTFSGTVQKAIRTIGLLRGLDLSPDVVLELLALDHLAKRPTSSLTAREARQVSMSLALAQTDVQVAIIHEPLLVLDDSQFVRFQTWLSNATTHACVVCVTASHYDARLLGGPHAQLSAHGWESLMLNAGGSRVRSLSLEGRNFRELASALALKSPCQGLWLTSVARGDALRVTGVSRDVTAKDIIAAARVAGATISRLWTEVVSPADMMDAVSVAQNEPSPKPYAPISARSAWTALLGEIRVQSRPALAPVGIAVLALEPGLALLYGVMRRTKNASWAGYDTLVFICTILTPLWSLWIVRLLSPHRASSDNSDTSSRFGITRRIAAFGRVSTSTALVGLLGANAAIAGTLGVSNWRAIAPAVAELCQSTWIIGLAGAVYGSIAIFLSSFKRRWLLSWAFILLDLMLGGTSRSIAFPFPRAHIHNLLGSPSSIQFSQQGSCAYLGFLLLLAAGLTLARTEP
jgi:hypothetical protein